MCGLNAAEWLIVKDTTEAMVLIHREDDSLTMTIPKE